MFAKDMRLRGEGGQDQVVEPLPEGYLAVEDANGGGKAQRKPAQPHGEHQKEHQSQPEGGDAAEDVAKLFQNPVGSRSRVVPMAQPRPKPMRPETARRRASAPEN